MSNRVFKLQDFAEVVSTSVKPEDASNYERFVGLEHYDAGEPVITRYTDTSLLVSAVKEFKENDILIARRNVYLKRAGIVFFSGVTSGDSIILRIPDTCIDKTGIAKELAVKIIPFVLNSEHFWAYANKHADGMNSKRISKDMLLEYEFELSSNELEEAKSEKLWAAYRLKESYKRLIAATDEMVNSQFIEMFDSVESFSALENIVSDTFPGEWGNEPTSSNAIKVIRTTNFTNEGRLDLSEVVTREIDSKKVSRKKLKKGDTILERSGGTKDNPVGRVVFFDEDGDYLFNNFTQVLRPKENVNPVYLFYSLYNSYNLNKAAMRAMASQTTGIQNLSMSDYMAKQIKLPSKKLQDKFESIYRQSDKSKFELKRAIEAVDKVIKSLING